MVEVVAPCQTRRHAEGNEDIARAQAALILRAADPGLAQSLAEETPPPIGDALEQWVDDALEALDRTRTAYEGATGRTEKEEEALRRLRLLSGETAASLRDWKRDRSRAAELLGKERANLATKVKDRVVFVGSISTGAADFVNTSIDARCPGVYLHGAAFNAIMTGDFWRAAPGWVTSAAILAMGALATLAIALFSPPKAFAAVLALAAAYAAINGPLLFDRHNLLVGAAGPLVTVGVVWAGVTLIQFIREIAERNRLTRRFSSYVDPTLVNYVVENPEQVRLEAHQKELTVCFSDLAGFTTLSEKLGARSAKVLGQYMEAMVPLIRARRGYVNKFLGDGIMFFCGAPVDNPDHAADAVAIVLDMQAALGPFNAELDKQGLPTLSMRTGVSTGMMVVGDAGPSFASDYTVLGDAVNLAARIESANKAFGTANLITARTADLLGGRFVIRPIADLLVVGKSESRVVYEAIAPVETATEQQKRVAALTKAVFDAFVAGRFDECLAAVAELETFAGPTKLTALYRSEAQTRRGQPPDPGFRGQIRQFTK
jgi:adenylate cyclase